MPELDAAQMRADALRAEVVAVIAALQSELHAKARESGDPALSTRWVQMSLDVTVAYAALGQAIDDATDALMVDEPLPALWERNRPHPVA